jgi:hypothetical protein
MTNTSTATDADARTTHRRRLVLIGGVVPVAIASIAAAAMISWIPELPDPIAVHWSGSGADGFGPAWSIVLLPLGLVLAFSVFAVMISWKPTVNGLLTASQKLVLVTSIWLSTLLSIGIGGSVFIQRGLEDATQAEDVGWFLLPATDPSPHTAIDPEPLELHETERVSWTRTVLIATAALVVAMVALCGAIVAVIVTATTAPEGVWFAVASLALVTLLLLGTGSWRVSADRRGLVVRSSLGWPRVTIPLSDIRGAQVVDVNPTADFGGWGWRWDAAGRSGIIMRSGSAIQVTRSSGKKFVVTVDDAATGAAVLAALLPEPIS